MQFLFNIFFDGELEGFLYISFNFFTNYDNDFLYLAIILNKRNRESIYKNHSYFNTFMLFLTYIEPNEN